MNNLSLREEEQFSQKTRNALFEILSHGMTCEKKQEIKVKHYGFQVLPYLSAYLLLTGSLEESEKIVKIALLIAFMLFAFMTIDILLSCRKIMKKAGDNRNTRAQSLDTDNIAFLFYDKDKFHFMSPLGIVLLMFSILCATSLLTFIVFFAIMILSIWLNNHYLVDTINNLNTHFAEN